MGIHSSKMSCLLNYLNMLANIIINKYFTDSCVLLLSQNHLNYNSTNSFVYINIDKNTKENINKSLNFQCENIVLESENLMEQVELMEKLIKLSVQRYNTRKYLLLTEKRLEEKQKFLLFQQLKLVPDVLVIMPDYANNFLNDCDVKFTLLTHTYVGKTNNDDVVQIDAWYSQNRSFLKNEYLFPDKITDMQGRVIKFATFTYKPYAIVGT